jgi:hypothetical protein
MDQRCDHESETHITLSPWGIEKEFICKKCGRKKFKGDAIVPIVYTGHGIRRNPKPYRPPEQPRKGTEKEKHWWQHW